ncbi:MAG TPA: hypothetical protein PK006_03770 [Saprospiraceae bacterium]|nr:hypothetical protein [Saprospiraceae bacterium]
MKDELLYILAGGSAMLIVIVYRWVIKDYKENFDEFTDEPKRKQSK